MLLLSGGTFAYALDYDNKKLDQAKRLIDSGKPASARPILKEVIRHYPGNADAHMQLGAVLAALCEDNKYAEAIAEEQKALQLDPQSSGARRILGMIYANQRKYDEAIALLEESCRLSSSSFAAQRDLGSAYLAAGKVENAVLAWKKALAVKPESITVRMRLATLFLTQKKYPDGITEALEAVKQNNSKAETHLLLANIKLQSGDAEGSVESFRTAIELNGVDSFGSKNPLTAADASSGLGWALFHSHEENAASIAEAISYQRKAIKAFPQFLPAHIRLAELLAKQNKEKEAGVLYQQLFVATQSNPAVGLPYASFLANSKRNEEARTVLKRVLQKWPDNKEASNALAALGN